MALNNAGDFGAACHGLKLGFPFSVADGDGSARIVRIQCDEGSEDENTNGASAALVNMLMLLFLMQLFALSEFFL